MPTIACVFPELAAALSGSWIRSALDLEWTAGDTNVVSTIDCAINLLPRALADDLDRALKVLRHTIDRLVQSIDRNATDDILVGAYYMQLSIASFAMAQCHVRGRAAEMTEWIAAGLSDDPKWNESAPVEFEVGRLDEVQSTSIDHVKRNATRLVCEWARLAYAYFRTMSAMPELAHAALEPVYRAIMVAFKSSDQEALDALLSVAFWAPNARLRADFAQLLESAFPRSSGRTAAVIATALAGPLAETTSRTLAEWARLALTDYDAYLEAPERLRLLGNLVGTGAEQYDELKQSIDSALEDFIKPTSTATHSDREQFLERAVNVLYPFISALLKENRNSDALSLIARWYDVRETESLTNASFAVPNSDANAYWSTPFERIDIPASPKDFLGAIDILNRTLKQGITIAGAHEYSIPAHTSSDIDTSLGKDFECLTATIFGFESQDVTSALSRSQAPWLPIMGAPFPVQSVAVRKMGFCQPITASFHEPLPERELQRAVLWLHDVEYGHDEATYVEAILRTAGIDVIFDMSGDGDDAARFQAYYEDPSFDVGWVIGHGRYATFAPQESHLNITRDSQLTISTLYDWKKPWERRRLLFLNVCDIARGASYGGLGRYSLAGALTGGNQTVIAHLWPADSMISAAAGIIFAQALVAERDHLKAYIATIARMSDLDSMKKCLLEVGASKLAHALAVRGDDSINIANLGSLAMLI